MSFPEIPNPAMFSNMVSNTENYKILSNLYDSRKNSISPERVEEASFDKILQWAFYRIVQYKDDLKTEEIPEIFNDNNSLNLMSDEINRVMTLYSPPPPPVVWSPELPMPTSKSGFGLAVVNNKLYTISDDAVEKIYDHVTGGWFDTNDTLVKEFDPMTGEWTEKSPMPGPMSGFGIEVVNDKIYVIGGREGENGVSNRVDEYDPATDTWTTKNSMPTGRAHFGTAAVNNKIYLIGGWEGDGSSVTATTRVDEYDPATDTWTTKIPMPLGAEIYQIIPEGNNEISIISRTERSGKFAPIQKYDPTTDRWEIGPNWLTLVGILEPPEQPSPPGRDGGSSTKVEWNLEKARAKEKLTQEIDELVSNEKGKMNLREILKIGPLGPRHAMELGSQWSFPISTVARLEVMNREDLISDIKANEEEIRKIIRLSIMDSLIGEGGAAGKLNNLTAVIPAEKKDLSPQGVEKPTAVPVETITPEQGISSEVKMPTGEEKLSPANDEGMTALEKGLSDLMNHYTTPQFTYTNMKTTQILMDISHSFNMEG